MTNSLQQDSDIAQFTGKIQAAFSRQVAAGFDKPEARVQMIQLLNSLLTAGIRRGNLAPELLLDTDLGASVDAMLAAKLAAV